MARRVTCRICKKKGDTDTFFRVTDDKGKNKYYCSQKEYDNYNKEIENRYNLMKYIAEDILDYQDGQIVPPVLVKRISELRRFYEYEVIKKCFEICKEDIQYWMGAKNFTNEYGMISYIMKIVEGNMNDTYNKWKFQQNQQQRQEVSGVDVEIINEVPTQNITVKADNGVLDFVEEDDL